MNALKKLWSLLREASGDADYARYSEHLRLHHPDRPRPTPEQFYLDRLKDKYSKPSRCC